MFSIFDLSPNWTSLIVLLILILVIYIFDRKNFKREGIVFMRRTKKGLEFIDSFARRHERFWKAFGSLGVMLSFGSLGVAYVLAQGKKKRVWLKTSIVLAITVALLSFILTPAAVISTSFFGAAGLILMELIFGAIKIISAGPAAAPVVQPVLPVQATGVYFVPIEFWLISIFVIMIVHEFAHAFVTRAENIRVKSIGYGFAAIIPLGFAEPDEAQLKKAESLKKARIYAAGSLSNFLTGIASLLLMFAVGFVASALFIPAGVSYSGTASGSPAEAALPGSGLITEINENRILLVTDIAAIMANVSVGEKISLIVDGKNYSLTTEGKKENASQAFMGITSLENRLAVRERFASFVSPSSEGVFVYLLLLFRWLFMLNVGIGLANLLPIKPLDGGLIFEEIIKRFWPKSWKNIYNVVAMTALGLLLLSIFWGLFGKALSAVI